ncbi:hypothetical protein LINPERHAP2_LOCUS39795 [Linum perenne]
MIGDRVFLVEYECLENICYTCGIYGHSLDSCPSTKKANEEPAPQETTIPTATVTEPEAETRRGRGKATKQQPLANSEKEISKEVPTEASARNGSRFTPL